jgi:hypothetical protein
MRIILVVLGFVTVGLAVWLASEHLWWIAIPDAAFGIALGIAAFESLKSDREAQQSATSNPAPAAKR